MQVALPIELWRKICRYATYVPLLLEFEWDYEPDARLWMEWPDIGDLDEDVSMSTSTKLAIPLVCRSWNGVGTELLYESVLIPDNPDALRRLVHVFENSKSGLGHGHGWWMKRIDCDIDVEVHPELVFSMLELCDSVQVFSYINRWRITTATYARMTEILGRRFSHSLRRVGLPMNFTVDFNLAAVQWLLPDGRLTSLAVIACQHTTGLPLPISFNGITTLTLYLPLPLTQLSMDWCSFPRLRNLALMDVFHDHPQALRPFMDRHKNTLRHLHIRTSVVPIRGLIPFLSHYSNLRSLTMDDEDFESLIREAKNLDAIVIPGVTHLGNIFMDGRALDGRIPIGYPLVPREVEALMRAKLFPDVRVIRIHMYPKEADGHWNEAVSACEANGVRLEDWTGQLLAATL